MDAECVQRPSFNYIFLAVFLATGFFAATFLAGAFFTGVFFVVGFINSPFTVVVPNRRCLN